MRTILVTIILLAFSIVVMAQLRNYLKTSFPAIITISTNKGATDGQT